MFPSVFGCPLFSPRPVHGLRDDEFRGPAGRDGDVNRSYAVTGGLRCRPGNTRAISGIVRPWYTSHSIESMGFAYPRFWMAQILCCPSASSTDLLSIRHRSRREFLA